MTVMFDSFFGVPTHVVRSGMWARMKPGEQGLYTFLCHHSEWRCNREITVKDAEITQFVGVSTRTLCNARKKLQERGLIQYRAGQGNKYHYTLHNPKTLQPYPGESNKRVDKPKGREQPIEEAERPERV